MLMSMHLVNASTFKRAQCSLVGSHKIIAAFLGVPRVDVQDKYLGLPTMVKPGIVRRSGEI